MDHRRITVLQHREGGWRRYELSAIQRGRRRAVAARRPGAGETDQDQVRSAVLQDQGTVGQVGCWRGQSVPALAAAVQTLCMEYLVNIAGFWCHLLLSHAKVGLKCLCRRASAEEARPMSRG